MENEKVINLPFILQKNEKILAEINNVEYAGTHYYQSGQINGASLGITNSLSIGGGNFSSREMKREGSIMDSKTTRLYLTNKRLIFCDYKISFLVITKKINSILSEINFNQIKGINESFKLGHPAIILSILNNGKLENVKFWFLGNSKTKEKRNKIMDLLKNSIYNPELNNDITGIYTGENTVEKNNKVSKSYNFNDILNSISWIFGLFLCLFGFNFIFDEFILFIILIMIGLFFIPNSRKFFIKLIKKIVKYIPKKVFLLIDWIFGLLFLLLGIFSILSKKEYLIMGIINIFLFIFTTPLIYEFIAKKINLKLSRLQKLIITILLLFIGVISLG